MVEFVACGDAPVVVKAEMATKFFFTTSGSILESIEERSYFA